MRSACRLILVVLALALGGGMILDGAAAQGDACDFEYSSCLAACREPGPPSPGCTSKCNQAYVNCEAGGVCSPFCN